jgi:allantoate deiminase
MTGATYAHTVLQRADMLASNSEEADRLTRRFATPAMQDVNDAVAGWMRDAGMRVQRDNIGNIWGRYEAAATGEDGTHGTKTLLLGSHLDTVRDAGKYDGPLGVLVAIACVQHLHDAQTRLPFAIEIVGFADEEGLRYYTGYLGSTAVAGTSDPAQLDLQDADGITMRDAIRNFGGDPDQIRHDQRAPHDLLGYLEVHIEQGPVLEAHNLPVGVVTAIQGQSRAVLSFRGEANHAGTVPMALRHDALCAAAEFILDVEHVAKNHAGLVATVGQLMVEPGASNVIPGHVTLSLDVRHADDTIRRRCCGLVQQKFRIIGSTRGVTTTWEQVLEQASVACDPQLASLLAQATEAQGYAVRHLPSGAGHDAGIMAQVTPAAMLFVRCQGGVSHNPAESVTLEDVAVTIDVVNKFLGLVAARETTESS